MQLNSVGIAGEVRCVVTKADGKIKTDTGYQKNLILNQGLDFFGGSKGSSINDYCAIGSGNSAPAVTQTGLDAYITQASGTAPILDYSYVDKGDNLYRIWEQKNYRFTGLTNVNISEVGLVSTGTSSTNYYLTTRALIKDSLGAPTSISVKTGETLDIYYKIHKVIDTRDKSIVINVLDGNGGTEPYNVVVRPSLVGASNWKVSRPNTVGGGIAASNADLVAITGLTNEANRSSTPTLGSYTPLSFKINFTALFALNQGNVGGIRTIGVHGSMNDLGNFQIRFGRVSDDAPIPKTANDTLTIPLEFSWSRYEGAL